MREILGMTVSQKVVSQKLSFEGMLVHIVIVRDRFMILIIRAIFSFLKMEQCVSTGLYLAIRTRNISKENGFV